MKISKWKNSAAGGVHRWPVYLLIAGVALVAALSAARLLMHEAAAAEPSVTGRAQVAELITRAETVGGFWNRVQRYYHEHVAPIQKVLLRHRDDPALTRRVALALVRNAHEVGVDPRILLAVLLVENPWIDPEIRSPVGAVGLMQVMPLHRGHWPPCESDLEDIEANICYGARIFAHYYNVANHDIEEALLRYNGCVNGTNTPNCHAYPEHVFARAGRASIMAWLEPRAVRAASP